MSGGSHRGVLSSLSRWIDNTRVCNRWWIIPLLVGESGGNSARGCCVCSQWWIIIVVHWRVRCPQCSSVPVLAAGGGSYLSSVACEGVLCPVPECCELYALLFILTNRESVCAEVLL